jgi:hypothetical protein
MNSDKIREELSYWRAKYDEYIDADHHVLAVCAMEMLIKYRRQLDIAIICELDPYTTEADVRYFEDWREYV